jgi:hypothetical protein
MRFLRSAQARVASQSVRKGDIRRPQEIPRDPVVPASPAKSTEVIPPVEHASPVGGADPSFAPPDLHSSRGPRPTTGDVKPATRAAAEFLLPSPCASRARPRPGQKFHVRGVPSQMREHGVETTSRVELFKRGHGPGIGCDPVHAVRGRRPLIPQGGPHRTTMPRIAVTSTPFFACALAQVWAD